jgi:hypothetical protein
MTSGSEDGRRLVVLQFLGGLDDDDKRRGAGADSAEDALHVHAAPRQLLGRRDGQDDLTGHRLEMALIVGRASLHEYVIVAESRWRLVAELALDRAAARDLDDQDRLPGDRSRVSDPRARGLMRWLWGAGMGRAAPSRVGERLPARVG